MYMYTYELRAHAHEYKNDVKIWLTDLWRREFNLSCDTPPVAPTGSAYSRAAWNPSSNIQEFEFDGRSPVFSNISVASSHFYR